MLRRTGTIRAVGGQGIATFRYDRFRPRRRIPLTSSGWRATLAEHLPADCRLLRTAATPSRVLLLRQRRVIGVLTPTLQMGTLPPTVAALGLPAAEYAASVDAGGGAAIIACRASSVGLACVGPSGEVLLPPASFNVFDNSAADITALAIGASTTPNGKPRGAAAIAAFLDFLDDNSAAVAECRTWWVRPDDGGGNLWGQIRRMARAEFSEGDGDAPATPLATPSLDSQAADLDNTSTGKSSEVPLSVQEGAPSFLPTDAIGTSYRGALLDHPRWTPVPRGLMSDVELCPAKRSPEISMNAVLGAMRHGTLELA